MIIDNTEMFSNEVLKWFELLKSLIVRDDPLWTIYRIFLNRRRHRRRKESLYDTTYKGEKTKWEKLKEGE